MRGYLENKYSNTQNMSIAGKLIWVQGEQIRRVTAEEYLKEKRAKINNGSRR